MAREVKLTKAGYERLMQQLERERERLQEATKILQELMESSDDYDDSGIGRPSRRRPGLRPGLTPWRTSSPGP